MLPGAVYFLQHIIETTEIKPITFSPYREREFHVLITCSYNFFRGLALWKHVYFRLLSEPLFLLYDVILFKFLV